MIIKDNNILIAEKGFVLTNGQTFGNSVELGRADKAENWHEITEEEYQKILKEQEAQDEHQANI